MKNRALVLFIVILLFTTIFVQGQSRSYKIYDQYVNQDGYTYFSFSKAMIDAVNLIIDEENKKVTGDLHEIRILILNDQKSNEKETLKKTLSEKFDQLNYKEIEFSDNKKGDNVVFRIDEDSERVKECHVILGDKENNQFSCMVSFYGNFKIEDLKSFEKFSRKQVEEGNK
jgi:Domain of unknown function (DUF4252)